MFDPQLESAGRQYTRTIAFLSVAFIFSPAVLFLSRPVGYLSLALAFGCSVVCVNLARINWKRYSRVSLVPILGAMLGTSLLHAGDLSSYRGFQFGMNLATAANHAGIKPSEAILVHQRPAMIQELDWRPDRSSLQAEAVKRGSLYFYNGELFRMVITYDRYKIEGMTGSDMIQAISATYGLATRPKVDIPFHSIYAEVAQVLARWEDSQYSYNLVRTGDDSSFALVLYSKRLDLLAEAATLEAVRLDAQEAPQREVELQKRKDEDSRLLLEKARSVNQPSFRP